MVLGIFEQEAFGNEFADGKSCVGFGVLVVPEETRVIEGGMIGSREG